MNLENLIKSLENVENDNKKFALLLILSELLKSNKLDESLKSNKALNHRLFNSIDPNFLARLITTKQQVDNSPILYKQVGLSILTQFLDFPELITDPVLLTKIDSIFDIIKSDCEENSTNLKLDAFKYLYSLSQACPEFLYQNGLIDILINCILLEEKYSESNLKLMYNFDTEDDTNFPIVSCKIISNLLKDIVDDKMKNKEFPFSKINEKIEKSFDNFFNRITKSQTEFKFKLINYLNFFLSNDHVKNYILTNLFLNELVSKNVLLILNDVFRSKIKQNILELGFLLLNNFVNLYDFELVYMKDRNFFYLLIHLLCIQISINLQQNELKISDDLLNKMSIYYSLLEQVIIILSTASPFDTGDDESDFSDDEDRTTEPEFEKVIKIVVEALETISLFIKDNLCHDFSTMDKNLVFLLAPSIRVLVCWMSHESLLEDEILEQMPKLIAFSEFLSQKSDFNLNLFKFLSSGLTRVLNDKKQMLDFKSQSTKLKEDLVKLEYETSELDEEIISIEKMLNNCKVNEEN
ncbi:unnamed protein product [Brachionus calyciflorus]|uniref:Neurochondrin n=1 Tax=Brachionus calyciflorus TaxID=104777 RepID=A0A813YR20_9BILA|nr:unnamed protein product [Brachionus calyciflorus]